MIPTLDPRLVRLEYSRMLESLTAVSSPWWPRGHRSTGRVFLGVWRVASTFVRNCKAFGFWPRPRIQSASFGCAVPLYNYILLHCLYVPAKLLLCGLLREMPIMDPQANWAFYNYRHLQMQIFSLKSRLGVKYHANADKNLGGDERDLCGQAWENRRRRSMRIRLWKGIGEARLWSLRTKKASGCRRWNLMWARLGEAKDEEPYRQNCGSLRIRGKRGSQTGITREAPSLELKA